MKEERSLNAQERQQLAIHLAMERRQRELQPIVAAIDDAIERVGWREARPIIEAITGCPKPRRRGRWWRGVGKRSGRRILDELEQIPSQGRLPLLREAKPR